MSEMVELIKQLRDRTGAGLMDCKHALVESSNDIEKAILWLREKGIAKQAKKASRIAAEGLTTIKIKDNRAVVLEINCETDFVAKSDPFIDLVNQVAQITIDQLPDNVEELKQAQNAEGKTVAELFTDAAIKLGEKLDLRRFVITQAVMGTVISTPMKEIRISIISATEISFSNYHHSKTTVVLSKRETSTDSRKNH